MFEALRKIHDLRLLGKKTLFPYTPWPLLFLSIGRSMGRVQQPASDLVETNLNIQAVFHITDGMESARLWVQHWSPLAPRFLALPEIPVSMLLLSSVALSIVHLCFTAPRCATRTRCPVYSRATKPLLCDIIDYQPVWKWFLTLARCYVLWILAHT